MNVFVTGGAGYIGSVVTELLLDSAHNVVVFDNFSTGHRAAIDPRAVLVRGDTADASVMRDAMVAAAPDVVVHMAAYIQMGESMQSPGKYFRNNAANTLNVLDAMLAARVPHMVFSSTAGVYGTPDELPVGEVHPLNPLNPYSESKRQVESILQWYAQAHEISATVFRFFNAAGATAKYGEDHRPESHLIPVVLQVAQGKQPYLDLYGTDYATRDGTASRDYIHVRDLAQAHLLAIERMSFCLRPPLRSTASRLDAGEKEEIHPHHRGGNCPVRQGDTRNSSSEGGGESRVSIYNLGSEQGATILEVVETARRITGCPILMRECPRRPGDAAASLASSARIRRELGWEPTHSDLETILGSAWDWLQRHPRGYSDVPSPTGDSCATDGGVENATPSPRVRGLG